jgi:hypothetical protein
LGYFLLAEWLKALFSLFYFRNPFEGYVLFPFSSFLLHPTIKFGRLNDGALSLDAHFMVKKSKNAKLFVRLFAI